MSTAEAAARSSTTGPPGSTISAGQPRRRFGRRSVTRRVPLVVWVLLLVPLLIELAWVFWPAFNSFQLSFTKWSGVGVAEPIGLKNYQTLLSDPIFHTAITNNVIWIVAFGGLSVVIGLALAVALNKPRRGVGVYRSAISSPWSSRWPSPGCSGACSISPTARSTPSLPRSALTPASTNGSPTPTRR